MVSALVPGANVQGSNPGRGHCVLFLGKTFSHHSLEFKHILPPQGFGPEAKTRGGTLGVPACIHTRTKNIC